MNEVCKSLNAARQGKHSLTHTHCVARVPSDTGCVCVLDDADDDDYEEWEVKDDDEASSSWVGEYDRQRERESL